MARWGTAVGKRLTVFDEVVGCISDPMKPTGARGLPIGPAVGLSDIAAVRTLVAPVYFSL